MSPIKTLPKQTKLTEPGDAGSTLFPSPKEPTRHSESEEERRRANETTNWSKLKFITRKAMLMTNNFLSHEI